MTAVLLCDWGTTNLRAWLHDPAVGVVAAREFALGVAKVGREAPRVFEQEVRPAMEATGLPALLCGMVGADLGWGGVGYRPCPTSLSEVADALTLVSDQGPPVRIVPGLSCRRPDGAPDVMRGEETQILGWLAAEPARARGRRLLCLPGTHSKWVRLYDARVGHFTTHMTGELYAVVMAHTILRGGSSPGGDSLAQEAAFEAGLTAGGDGMGLAASLFSARARVALGLADLGQNPAYVSGVLIGSEIACALRGLDPDGLQVELIGSPALCGRYARALDRRGVAHRIHDGDAAALAGLIALRQAVGDLA